MKEVYIKPYMITESFMPNQAVSTCTIQNNGIKWTFDCMAGKDTDSATVVTVSGAITNVEGSCTKQVGYAQGISTAYDFNGSKDGHSNNNKNIAQWGNGKIDGSGNYSGDYVSVTYTGAKGLLYADSNGDGKFNIDEWSDTAISGVVAHSKKQGGMHHMVAPVLNSYTINASW